MEESERPSPSGVRITKRPSTSQTGDQDDPSPADGSWARDGPLPWLLGLLFPKLAPVVEALFDAGFEAVGGGVVVLATAF